MKQSYILFKALLLSVFTMVPATAQPDTVVLNSTEFRFPETHPGKVFVVSKVIVNGQPPLKKGVEHAPAEGARTLQRAENRDLLGRRLHGEAYASRLARIRKKHELPTVPGLATPRKGLVTGAQGGDFSLPEGARLALVSNSPLLRNAGDLARLEKAEREAVRRKYGTLGKTFAEQVSALRENDSLDILVELEKEHPGYVNGVKVSMEERIRNGRAWANARPRMSPLEFLHRHGLKPLDEGRGRPRNTRLVQARASKAQILGLKEAQGVVSVSERKKPEVNAVPRPSSPLYPTLLASSHNPTGSMVESESGLGVATIESGLGSDYVSRLPDELKPVSYDVGWWGSVSGSYSTHSEGTYQLLAAGASGFQKYHYDEGYFGNIQDSIFNYHIASLSSSFANYWPSVTSPDSRAVDNMSYTYPYPLISLTAGNDGPAYTPDAQTYNSLIMGMVQHYDEATFQMDLEYWGWDSVNGFYVIPVAGTQWKNPPAKYGVLNDWELPSLVAPGFGPDPAWGVCFTGVWKTPTGVDWCPPGGTSFSAPVAAAMAAQVMANRSSYASPNRPTDARAVLLLTAENVDSGSWTPTYQDSRDGAGTISAANAVNIQLTKVDNEEGPHVAGIKSGYMSPEDFTGAAFITESYLVPGTIPSGMHLRLVLTWTSSPGINYAENEISDVSLFAHTNWGWRWSETWNSNTEIIDIPNASLTPNTSYDIKVYPTVHRTATDGPEEVYYTLAWAWVKDHAD
jgi:hypothetical protein